MKVIKKICAWAMRSVRGFLDNDCPLHAAGLTYFTLLALVPILCCILVTAKACGVDRMARKQINAQIDAAITNIERAQEDPLAKLTPADKSELERKKIAASELARQVRRVSNELFERINRFDVGTLGWIGFGMLLWTVISTLSSVETSFNRIFGAEKGRSVLHRSWMYLLIMVVLPILSAIAMSLPVLAVIKNAIVATMGSLWLTKWVSDGLVWLLDSIAVRLLFTLAASTLTFTFFFWAVPNAKVPVRHALYGGFITAILFGGWMKLCAIAQVGIANSSALYGSFAFLPIILAWNYMSWQIILFGANMVRSFGDTQGYSPKELEVK